MIKNHIFFYKNICLTVSGLSCSMWDLVSWPEIKPRPPAFRAWRFSHWTTREVPQIILTYLDLDKVMWPGIMWKKEAPGEVLGIKFSIHPHLWKHLDTFEELFFLRCYFLKLKTMCCSLKKAYRKVSIPKRESRNNKFISDSVWGETLIFQVWSVDQ